MTMKPGPVLDAAVAERVMGWKPREIWAGGDEPEMVIPACPDDWSPSTDWRAAGEVLDHVAKSYKLELYRNQRGWCCIMKHGRIVGAGSHGTGPGAIAKAAAALAAMEEKT